MPQPELTGLTGEKYAVPLAFASAEELARSEEVDLVVLTVKVPHHLELIRPALEAGKMVFSEWPLGADLAQAEELADLAHRRGVLTAVGLQARSAPPLRYLRDLVAEGYVGRVLSTNMLGAGWIGGATYDDNYAYVLDVTSGATLLSIPFGHSVDALTMVLGEFREVSALIENLRPEVTSVTSGAVAAKSAEDQIAVTGVLESGTVAAMRFRGGTSRATAFHWEINGTEGDLVVKADRAQWWYGGTKLYGARGEEGALTELPVPARYHRVGHRQGRPAPGRPRPLQPGRLQGRLHRHPRHHQVPHLARRPGPARPGPHTSPPGRLGEYISDPAHPPHPVRPLGARPPHRPRPGAPPPAYPAPRHLPGRDHPWPNCGAA
ncbi:Gfo/Idh/MocA family oxidoreductase [Streptomyces mirabilis]|uniref:Gfo/Idh/MocA family protein n=1 Tax=Streptomyces mirabilis TaxID=68239 RepID=UPI0036B19870